MELDGNGLEVLSRSACLRLVGGALVGRVVVTDRALPAAFPVNFTLLDDDIVFRTSGGSKLDAAAAGSVVAFEVDDIDPVHQSGWSVLIQGWAYVIVDPEELRRAHALPLQRWAPTGLPHFIRIRSEIVSGRRLPSLAVRRANGVLPAVARGSGVEGVGRNLERADGLSHVPPAAAGDMGALARGGGAAGLAAEP